MKKRNIMREFEIDEISGVDFPAQEGAKVLLMKRDVEKVDPSDFSMPMLTDVVKGAQHLLDASKKVGRTTFETTVGQEFGHSHATLMKSDGTIVVAVSEGHSHEVLPTDKRDTSNSGEDDDATKASHPDGGRKKKKDKKIMNPDDKKAADDVKKADEEKLAKLEADLKFAKKFGDLKDGEKEHYSKLDDAKKKEFIDMDEATRKRELEKIAGENPVVYTSDAGEMFRKNDDPRLVRLAKQSDEDRKLAKTERDLRMDTELTKRAEKEMPNLGAKVGVKKAMLKAIDGITDEATRKDVLEIVASANKAVSGVFNKIGHEDPGSEGGDAYTELEVLAKKYAETNKCDIVKARSLVLDTDEGAELYAKMAGR